jgi:AraC-like DNA-binding protein
VLRTAPPPEIPAPGGIAWLDVSAETNDSWPVTVRTGPLGLQIAPLGQSRAPFFFKGARLRGTRCIFSAATLSATEMYRLPRSPVPALPSVEGSVHLMIRSEGHGSVFDAATSFPHAALRLIDPASEVREHFPVHSHLCTLNVQQSGMGIEAGSLTAMADDTFLLTEFQIHIVRSAVSLLLARPDSLHSAASLIGVDRYLSAVAGLLLRTSVRTPTAERERLESVRARTESIIYEQACDAELTPGAIAAQLNISLRQLYRAFTGSESPAARIRRRRLEHAADLLSARHAPAHVDEIAQECGFESAEYFSRAFRREFGLSPRAYRSAYGNGANGTSH